MPKSYKITVEESRLRRVIVPEAEHPAAAIADVKANWVAKYLPDADFVNGWIYARVADCEEVQPPARVLTLVPRPATEGDRG